MAKDNQFTRLQKFVNSEAFLKLPEDEKQKLITMLKELRFRYEDYNQRESVKQAQRLYHKQHYREKMELLEKFHLR